MPSVTRWTILVAVLLLLPAPVLGGATPAVPGVDGVLAQGEGPYDVVVTFDGPPGETARRQLQAWSPTVTWYEVVPGAHVVLSRDELASLGEVPGVAAVHPDEGLDFTLASSKRALRAGQAIQDLGYTGEGVGVAVVDSGIDTTHPALEDQVVANVQVWSDGTVVPITGDAEGHGTHVAGIVAGTGAESPSASLRGVASGAHLVGIDVSKDFTTSTVLAAYDWIVDHQDAYDIRVVTASWGRTDKTYDPSDPIVQASSELVEHGIVVIYSSGNQGPDRRTLSVEAQNPDVLAVGAVDDSAQVATFSSRGPGVTDEVKPDLVAPGVSITSTRSTTGAGGGGLIGGLLGGDEPEGTDAYYGTRDGTSQASPHVAGLVALMLAADPSLRPGGIEAALEATAVDLGAEGTDPTYGYGLADAKAALHLVLGKDPPKNVISDGGTEIHTFRGEITGTGGAAVQTFPTLETHSDGVAEATFPVKPGAASIRVSFAWSPKDAGFEVYLSHDGRMHGPYTDSEVRGSERVIVVERSEGVEQGTWTVLAEPDGTGISYRSTVTVDYAFTSTSTDRGTPRPGPDPGPVVPLMLVALAGLAGVIVFLYWKRRRRASRKSGGGSTGADPAVDGRP